MTTNFIILIRYTIRYMLCCITLCYASLPVFAQQSAARRIILPQDGDFVGTRYGAVLNLNYNIHTATFRQLPNVPFCCPSFGGGMGTGYTLGLLYGFPVSPNTLLNFRTTLSTHDALLSSEHFTDVYLNGVNVSGKAAHELNTRLISIGIEPLLGYHLGEGLFVHGGLRVAALEKALYRQEDHIIQPGNTGTFINPGGMDSRERVRYEASGELERLLFQGGVVVGTSYEIPISRNGAWLLSPEIFFYYALTPLISGVPWHAHSLRAGVSLIYTPKPPVITRYDTVYRRDTVVRVVASLQQPQIIPQGRTELTHTERISQYQDIVVTTVTDHFRYDIPEKQNTITASLNISGLNAQGKENALALMRIEEFRSDIYHPLLPYIFFDNASAVIPSRYRQYGRNASSLFHEGMLHGDSTLDIYHNILNIIGSRLHNYPEATITLTGCNANAGAEENDTVLSLARATAIRDYLLQAWNIEAQRIQLQARNLPSKPSNPLSQDGSEENRRVEIQSSLPLVTDVVVTHDTIRRTNPPVLRFTPEVQATVPVRYWMLFIEDEGNVMKEFSGNGMPPPVIDWMVETENFHHPEAGNSELTATLFLRSETGISIRTRKTFTIEHLTIQHKKEERLGDTLIERYGILLFDYGSPDIDERNAQTISFLRSRLQPSSKLCIEGYTDRTGDDETNLHLSAERAGETARAIGSTTAVQDGYGKRKLLYNNALPEGRHYCRTVRIKVETPQR